MDSTWGNTALVAYSLLPKIVRELDFAVKRRINSSFQSNHLKFGVTTEQLIGEILGLIDEKRKIINLVYIVNSTLEKMHDKDAAVLKARVIEKKTFQVIAKEKNLALRTVFRRFDNAGAHFANLLKAAGYSESWFENEYGNDKYIAPVKARLANQKYAVAKGL